MNYNRRTFIKSTFATSVTLAFPLSSLLFNSNSAYAIPRSERELTAIADLLTKTGLQHGNIPSLNSPEYLSVGDASMGMENTDIVFVYSFPEEPEKMYIIPQKVMVWHEVLNEVVRGNAYSLTYSPISGSLALYSTTVQRKNLIFDTFGSLYNSNSVLIDRNTGSLWSQLLGMCFKGDLFGLGLKILPVFWTNWRTARIAYPKAKVLASPKANSTRIYGRDPYGSYVTKDSYYQNENLYFPLTHFDSRMPPKTFVLGIEDNNALIAVDINYIKEKQVVNFYLGPRAFLALYDKNLDIIRIFDRQFWEAKDPSLFTFRDNNVIDVLTKSIWTREGKCIEGKLQGAALEEFFGVYSFWFAWAAMHPETFTVPGETIVPDAALDIGV